MPDEWEGTAILSLNKDWNPTLSLVNAWGPGVDITGLYFFGGGVSAP